MLSEFDIRYIPQKSIKGRVMSNFLADLPMQEQKEETFDFPNEEVLYVE